MMRVGSSFVRTCHATMVSVRAVATAATCRPRFARIRWKKARSGPGAVDAAQSASTSIARACERPRLCCGRAEQVAARLDTHGDSTRHSSRASQATESA
jgi:hypothetical protein